MFLAPLNYDRFFRKVFSHVHIAKSFLEDFLDVTISDIELLKDKHQLTDDSTKVEFDFRCTIGNADIIVDMQQWYKTDVVQRFYTYHTAGTVLQLEKMPDKKLSKEMKDKRIKGKDYKTLKPVLTLIWMVDDTLHFKENFVGYVMTPELVTDFVRNVNLWKKPEIVKLLKAREEILKILGNDTKNLDFLPKNRLIFLFQPNIVNDKSMKKYLRWFRFAEKTKNENNTERDFEEFKKDPVFQEIMRLINRKDLTKEDLDYIETEAENEEMFQRFLTGEYNSAFKDGKKEGKEEGREEGREEVKKTVAILMIQEGDSNERISRFTGFPKDYIEQLRQEINHPS